MKTEYFYIGEDGNIHLLGTYDDIEDAFNHIDQNQIIAIYVFSKETATEWLEQLKHHLQ